MKSTNQTLITAFALFSLFFGAGNLILPPFLGHQAGTEWMWVILGFAVSAVVIPILGILAHARLQGTMLDFGNKVHPVFSLVFCILVYVVSISIPAPRTASVTYEMAVMPYFELDSLSFSAIYFGMVLLFALNRTRVLHLIAKYLTPLLLLMLFVIIGIAIFGEPEPSGVNRLKNPFTNGILEGYQTFDAIGAIVVGAVVIISLNLKNVGDYHLKRKLIMRGGILAGLGLLGIYAGLIYIGALYPEDQALSRTDLLSFLSYETLGSGGRLLLSALIGVACFTTAVGIVTGTADFVQGLFKGNLWAYRVTACCGAILGVGVGALHTDLIIDIAVPALYFIYPLTIVLILLNVMPKKLLNHWVFKAVVLVTLLFSIPDFLHSINVDSLDRMRVGLPLGDFGLGWAPPAVVVFIMVNILLYFLNGKNTDVEEAPK